MELLAIMAMVNVLPAGASAPLSGVAAAGVTLAATGAEQERRGAKRAEPKKPGLREPIAHRYSV